ncbi:hypothetical protein KC207_14235 [Phycicoccus sp. BSK3Z-2]|uniref:Uncharacterized protein n=1 Tax=Phycicoccus avicenniae TaxID=2828860 RepID=A0A941DBL9_9MICO|nr:hypothetical protein [Phycicoccus avicenniae]MBR7744450.1 hypothetical protein [Phycicoccus avicenniae]
MTPTALLAAIPDELLFVGHRDNRSRAKRARGLLAWLEANNCRPTFADLEAERRRRGLAHLARKEGTP